MMSTLTPGDSAAGFLSHRRRVATRRKIAGANVDYGHVVDHDGSHTFGETRRRM